MGKDQYAKGKHRVSQKPVAISEIELEARFGRDITNLCRSVIESGSVSSNFNKKTSLQKGSKTRVSLQKQDLNKKVKQSKQRTVSEASDSPKADPKELGMDINNLRHCELASGYHRDILSYLQTQEPTIRPWLPSLRGLHTERDMAKLQQQRIEQVEWIVKVHNDFDLKAETCLLSLNIFDRCVSLLATKDWQLLACASIRLASKYEEILVNELTDYQWLCKQKYDKKQIVDAELEILFALGFAVHQTCHFTVMERVRLLLGIESSFQDITAYVVKICQMSTELAGEDQFSLSVAVGTLVAKAVYGKSSLPTVTKSCNVSLSRIIDIQFQVRSMIEQSIKRCLNPARKHLCKKFSAAEVTAIDRKLIANSN